MARPEHEASPQQAWLLRRIALPGEPNPPRRQVEGVALSEEDARLWQSEARDHVTEQVPVWKPALMMVGRDVNLDDPETAEALEDIRQAAEKRLRARLCSPSPSPARPAAPIEPPGSGGAEGAGSCCAGIGQFLRGELGSVDLLSAPERIVADWIFCPWCAAKLGGEV